MAALGHRVCIRLADGFADAKSSATAATLHAGSERIAARRPPKISQYCSRVGGQNKSQRLAGMDTVSGSTGECRGIGGSICAFWQ